MTLSIGQSTSRPGDFHEVYLDALQAVSPASFLSLVVTAVAILPVILFMIALLLYTSSGSAGQRLTAVFFATVGIGHWLDAGAADETPTRSPRRWPAPAALRGGADDGLPAWLGGGGGWPAGLGEAPHPREAPRVSGPQRDLPARLRCLGDAVVPRCGWVIGKAIQHMESTG